MGKMEKKNAILEFIESLLPILAEIQKLISSIISSSKNHI
jgi:hypothetical protein